MQTQTNPLEAFAFRQNYMHIDRKVSATGDTTITLTGGTKENRINAILTNIFSPKGFRLARPILEKSEGLANAARVVIVRYDRNTPKIGGGMTLTMFDAAGQEMWDEYLTVGPRGKVFYAGESSHMTCPHGVEDWRDCEPCCMSDDVVITVGAK